MDKKYFLVFFDLFKNLKPSITGNVTNYNFQIFKKDFFAGLTVSAILIPNTMGYAILAGLPPAMGLYAALPAVLAASLWGSSMYVITAPVGVVSLLAATSLSEFARPNTNEFITLAISLAVLVGLIQFLLGFFKLGVLARLIPHSALVGFTNAAAILIVFSQLPSIFGHPFIEIFQTGLHLPTFAIGVVAIAVILLIKRYYPKIPASLFIIIISISLSEIVSLEPFGIKLIGYIPFGLPHYSFEGFSFSVFYVLLKQAVLIALVGFVETYSIAQTLAKKKNEKISADRELNGQGLANIFSGIFGGFPVSGSFSASALNENSGAKTSVSSLVVSLVILSSLFLLGPFLSLIPKPVLAAVVISAVIQLVDFKKFGDIYRLSKRDGVIALVTFITALIFKPDDALFVGIILAISFFVLRSMDLKMSVVGIHKIHRSLWTRESAPSEDLILTKDKLILRLDYSIIFSNADLLEDLVMRNIKEYEKEFSSQIKHVILNCAGVNYIDLSGIEALINLENVLEREGINLSYMLVKDVVLKDFEKTGMFEKHKYFYGERELRVFFEEGKV